MDKKNILPIGLMIVAFASRLIPHIPNFTPLESIALFGGVYLTSKRLSFLLPIAAIYFSDLILNNTIYKIYYPDVEGMVWISTYMIWTIVAIVGITSLGHILKNRLKPSTIIGFSFLGSILFFVVSNFGVWAGSLIYPKSLLGLIECYTAAIPFFRNSLISNMVFTIALFGLYELLSKKVYFLKKYSH
jgi:hypothetical protein